MAENCNHDCSSCGQDCADRKPTDFSEHLNEYSSVKKVIGVVSGKGGVGKRGLKDRHSGCGHHRTLHPQGVRTSR